MSQQPARFDETVADAADCVVAHLGSVDAAIEQLAERRKHEDLGGRIEEALAYLRYQEGSE